MTTEADPAAAPLHRDHPSGTGRPGASTCGRRWPSSSCRSPPSGSPPRPTRRRRSRPSTSRSSPSGAPAPELHAKGWLNSPPLSAGDLAGKVVVYDFWTYSCVNCVRTLPYLRSWHDRYRDDGLVIVGVHSPEFDFEKDHGNVEQAVSRLKVTWPVALDDDMAIWDDFDNRYWPAKWITDRQGRIRYFHAGEGNYAETENVIRTLLGVDASRRPGPHDPKEPRPAPDEVVQNITQETYLGTERGSVAEDGPARLHPGRGAAPPAGAGRHLAGRAAADPLRLARRLPLAPRTWPARSTS